MDAREIVAALRGRLRGNTGTARCPAHDDKNPSLSVSEGGALVKWVEAGRELCRQAIPKYVDEDAPALYRAKLEPLRDQLRDEVVRHLEARP
jgi:hypothetical protein